MRSAVLKGYGYYIEKSQFRDKDCVDSHARIRMDDMDQLVVDLLKGIRLPEA